ncbi:MAG: cell wall/surface repeat protein [Spirochaetes bacterium]|nr:MAG: cell wall/surface repeat protein [Spirochaetota bacterium]
MTCARFRSSPWYFAILLTILPTILSLLASCDLLALIGDVEDPEGEQTPPPPAITMMSLGFRTSMLIKDDGILYATGSNGSGEMGAIDIPAAGAFFINEDGSLHASGGNSWGQLGAGSSLRVGSALIPLGEGVRFKQIAFTGTSSLALDESGEVWVTGDNNEGSVRAADGTAPRGDRFAKLSAPGYLQNVKAIAGSSNHSLYILQDGSVWACGDNAFGQLGTGGSKIGDVKARQMLYVENAVAVAAGANHSLILDPKAIASSQNTSYALTLDGELFASGDNTYGQAGTGSASDVFGFTNIMSDVESIAAGTRHAIFLKKDKSLWAVGHNYFGQLGDCTDANRSKPVRVYY